MIPFCMRLNNLIQAHSNPAEFPSQSTASPFTNQYRHEGFTFLKKAKKEIELLKAQENVRNCLNLIENGEINTLNFLTPQDISLMENYQRISCQNQEKIQSLKIDEPKVSIETDPIIYEKHPFPAITQPAHSENEICMNSSHISKIFEVQKKSTNRKRKGDPEQMNLIISSQLQRRVVFWSQFADLC